MEFYDIDKNSQFLISQKLLIIRNNKLLVLRNYTDLPNDKYGGYWVLPGGLLEFKEELETGLEREVLEEVGLKVKIGRVVAVSSFNHEIFVLRDKRKMKTRVVRIFYTADKFEGKVSLGSDGEHDKYMWSNKEEIKRLETFSGTKPAFDWFINNY
jgi:8-oxo-dGTP diphosphatase